MSKEVQTSKPANHGVGVRTNAKGENAEQAAKRIKAEADAEAAKKAKAEAEKAAKAEAAVKKAADAKAAKEANQMPMQNGIRRPKADGLCGKAWAIFDEVSTKNKTPASIGESMEIAKAKGLNEANVRAEYARWRKFYGISGRIAAAKTEAAPAKEGEASK